MFSLHAAVAAILLSNPGDVVLLDFYADWCAPCRAMTSTVDALAAKGYPVRKVNFDRDKALVQQYGVTSIPCFIVVANGRKSTARSAEPRSTSWRTCARRAWPRPLRRRPGRQPAMPCWQVRRARPLHVTPVSMPAASSQGTVHFRWGENWTVPRGENWDSPRRKIGTVPGATAADDPLLAASVRLRIEDARGRSVGSGTIIDTRNGDALILTCGHVFRDSKGKGRIEVDVFGPRPAEKIPGELVAYDLESDVGLWPSARQARWRSPGCAGRIPRGPGRAGDQRRLQRRRSPPRS